MWCPFHWSIFLSHPFLCKVLLFLLLPMLAVSLLTCELFLSWFLVSFLSLGWLLWRFLWVFYLGLGSISSWDFYDCIEFLTIYSIIIFCYWFVMFECCLCNCFYFLGSLIVLLCSFSRLVQVLEWSAMWSFVSCGSVIHLPSSFIILYCRPLQPLALFMVSHVVFGCIIFSPW